MSGSEGHFSADLQYDFSSSCPDENDSEVHRLENSSRLRTFEATRALLLHNKSVIAEVADSFALSFPQMHVLHLLEPDNSFPMRHLAEAMHCDPSNVTGITDRLEAMGLVERHADADDRRVRALVLTDKGKRVRSELIERMMDVIGPCVRLDPDELVQFCALVDKAIGTSDEPPARHLD
jgi:DNA-binding MarR family transcriptional regulator